MSNNDVTEAVSSSIYLPDGYLPNDSEEFMSDMQKEYFKLKLLSWKEDIIQESEETLKNLANDFSKFPDMGDRALHETSRSLELRARDRHRKLISKINEGLERIKDGTYGYCEITGDPISLKRLIARPIATMSIDAQEQHEKDEKIYRDD